MRQSLFILSLLVLFASACPADIVIRADTAGVGTYGHSGTTGDPLVPGELIYVDVILNHNPHPNNPDYDGYLLSGCGIDINVIGPGTLGVGSVNWNPGFSLTNDITVTDNSSRIYSASMNGIVGEDVLISGFWIQCFGFGTITFDLSLNDYTQYAEYNTWPGPGTGPWDGWIYMTDPQLGDLILGDLAVQGIPEPASFFILMFGALALRKKW